MTQSNWMSQQIAQAAIAVEEQRLGRKPTSVTVLLGGDTLVITMNGILSRAEQSVAATPVSAVQLQEFHQKLFHISSIALMLEITRITGLEVRRVDPDKAMAAVQVFSIGTVVQIFLLDGNLASEAWRGT